MKALIQGDRIFIVGEEIIKTGNNYRAITGEKSHGISISGDVIIIDTDVLDDNTTNLQDYKYNAETGEITERPKTKYTKNDFIELFTGAEWRKFTKAVETDDNINKFYSQILVVDWIELADVRIQQAMQYCVAIEVITQERYNEIFANVL